MGGQKTGFESKFNPDITADLPYPYGQIFKQKRGQPQSNVVSFIDGLPCFLERSLLPAPKHI
jgi:hypothetical protein